MQFISISDNVFVTNTNEYTYFLDLNKNRYKRIILPLRLASQINSHSAQINTNQLDKTSRQAIAYLLCKGLVSKNEPPKFFQCKPQKMIITSTIFDVNHTTSWKTIKYLPTFLTAMYCSGAMIKNATIIQLSRKFEHINRNIKFPKSATPSIYTKDLINKVDAFHFLRKFHSRKKSCLPDSLALALFLAKHSFPSNIVFGIREDPFLAHCWVQIDEIALNDRTCILRDFSPIYSMG